MADFLLYLVSVHLVGAFSPVLGTELREMVHGGQRGPVFKGTTSPRLFLAHIGSMVMKNDACQVLGARGRSPKYFQVTEDFQEEVPSQLRSER